jgi:hypothetical protein
MQAPLPHGLTNRLCRLIADRRIETDKESTPAVLRSPRPKRIPQEIEFLLRRIPSPVIILTVNNLRLLQVQFQPTFSKTPLNRHPKTFRFGFAPTVTNPIIGISLERDLWIIPLHPLVERIMQKEIRK